MVKKKALVWIIGIVLLFGLLIFISYQGGFKPFALTSYDFVKPSWARLECAPTDAYEGELIKWLDQQTLFKCDAFTEECLFNVWCTNCGGWLNLIAYQYKECDITGQNCGSYTTVMTQETNKILPPIKSGRSYSFKTTRGAYLQLTETWKPWKTYRFVGAQKTILNSFNCDIRTGDLAKIRAEDSVNKLFRQGGEGTKWINYVDDWFYGPATNIVLYKGQEGYCTGGKVYSIVKLKMADGSLKKVDPTYKGITQSGDTINGLGSVISGSDVECCPNEAICGDDFRYTPTPPQKECFSDLQCRGAGGPVVIDCNHYRTYGCGADGICKEGNIITVDCTSSACCGSKGKICDLSVNNYGHCINQITDSYCGDGVCNFATENTQNCQADCGKPTGNTCSSCFSWAGSLFKKEENKCIPESFIKKWYLPASVENMFTQNTICPFILLFYAVGGVLVIMLVVLVVKITMKLSKKGSKRR